MLKMEEGFLDIKLETSLKKAVDPHETPVKQKHIRATIIGTFQPEPGAQLFWALGLRLPAMADRIVAWKFCHVLHKILREGHPLCLLHSQRHMDYIDSIGKLWGHLRESYGQLIRLYTKLLMVKLRFHDRHQRFPGHLGVTREELNSICSNVDDCFEITVDMFDYLDAILELQAAIFGSLDMSRFTSMTVAGQCRLAPLIPCIQDAARLYDCCVKILIRLHNTLSPELLIGHRDRFLKQFRLLRSFFRDANALQYFKDLISIPLLPDHPPDFLIRASMQNYVTQEVKVKEPEPEPEPVGNLVDTTVGEAPKQLEEDRLMAITLERDTIILKLRVETDRLRAEISRLHQTVQENSQQMQERVLNLESELATKESELQEVRQLKEEQAMAVANSQDSELKTRDEKFSKLRDLYTKLRGEHIDLIRTKSEVEKCKLQLERSHSEQLQKTNDARMEIQNQLQTLQDYLKSANSKREEHDRRMRQESELMLRRAADEVDNPALAAVQCSPDYLKTLSHGSQQSFDDLIASLFSNAEHETMWSVRLAHSLSSYIVLARATCNSDVALLAPEEMTEACKATAECAIATIRGTASTEDLLKNLARIAQLAESIGTAALNRNADDEEIEDPENSLDAELARMHTAIEEAAGRIQEILSQSRKADTGVKLEVNGKILDACNDLMAAIVDLVKRARSLQGEIVADGKGQSDTKEFYKRNHRWTDGFISAAKSVAAAATFLLSTADHLVGSGDGKLEQVAVAAQEIAACTAQLVVASRVKASRTSDNLTQLMKASKAVSQATGAVVATAKACAQLVDDAANELDVSKLGLHQAKKLEMEAQVRVLELESQLQQERTRLSALRRHHYQLAGE